MDKPGSLALLLSAGLLVGMLIGVSALLAQTPEDGPPVNGVVKKQVLLRAILTSIKQYEQDLKAVQEKRESPEGEALKEELHQQIRDIDNKLDDLRNEFEQIVTGVDPAVFAKKEEVSLDWTKEIQILLGPVLNELRRLTARAREIDRLRMEIGRYEEQRLLAQHALENAHKLTDQILDAALAPYFMDLQQEWERRQQEVDTQLAVLHEELQRKLSEQKSFAEGVKDLFQSFFRSRGRNFILACLALLLFWVVLSRLHHWISEVSPFHRNGPTLIARAFNVFYIFLTAIGAIAIFLLVLYLFEDWVLIALSIIFLLGIAWAAKNALPWIGYQLMVLLGMGAMREGERVVYNGVPWLVRSLNFYAIIVNPELVGGYVRLPLHAIAELHSRPFEPGEPWFPTRTDDWVLLADQTLGRVALQTPEIVQLAVGSSLRTFNTPDFLAQHPTVLATGFVRLVRFGIDYRHQALATREIPATLQSRLTEDLARQGYDSDAVRIEVEFEEAGESALQFVVLARCSGAVAPRYIALQRAIQRICVDACNDYGWVIPFPQLTLHMASLADVGPTPAHDEARQDGEGAKRNHVS